MGDDRRLPKPAILKTLEAPLPPPGIPAVRHAHDLLAATSEGPFPSPTHTRAPGHVGKRRLPSVTAPARPQRAFAHDQTTTSTARSAHRYQHPRSEHRECPPKCGTYRWPLVRGAGTRHRWSWTASDPEEPRDLSVISADLSENSAGSQWDLSGNSEERTAPRLRPYREQLVGRPEGLRVVDP